MGLSGPVSDATIISLFMHAKARLVQFCVKELVMTRVEQCLNACYAVMNTVLSPQTQ